MKSRSKLKALFILGLMGALCSSCSGVFYQPSREWFIDPVQLQPTPKDLSFRSEDGTELRGWLFNRKNHESKKSRGLILQCHGNAENMTSHFLSLFWLLEYGFDLMTFDYRGYGASQGSPSQSGVVADGVAAIELARNEAKNLGSRIPVILYGQSLGGVVCMKALEKIYEKFPGASPVQAVVIEGSFLSYRAVARDVLSRNWITWIFQPLGNVLVSDEMALGSKPSLWKGIPNLVIHGSSDRVIPEKFGKIVYEWLENPKSYWSIPNSGHLETFFMSNGKYKSDFVQRLNKMLIHE